MELLSDVVSLMNPDLYMAPSLDVGGDWAIQFPAHRGIKFDIVLQGSCWIQVQGDHHPYKVEQGDCFLLTSGRPFLAGSDLALIASDAHAIFTEGCDSRACHQGGGDFLIMGGRFTLSGQEADALFCSLPSVIVHRADSEEASTVRSSLATFVKELRGGKPGSTLSLQYLARLMLIQTLRANLESDQRLVKGWWTALRDAQLSSAISAMHEDPARSWTLVGLAKVAAMSRSSFADKFKRVVGETPLEYLTRWRMRVAAQRLDNTTESVIEIAHGVGYTSESAFSTAFKKYSGEGPRNFRKMRLGNQRQDVEAF